jgi:hypothetical protein
METTGAIYPAPPESTVILEMLPIGIGLLAQFGHGPK